MAIRIAAPGARTLSTRAALLGSVCIGALTMLVPGVAHAVDGTWTGPGGEWTTGTNWSSSPAVPDNMASFTNNGAPPSVTISNNAAINIIDFAAAAPAYSFTVQNSATFTVNSISNSSSFMPDFSVSSGATLAIGDGSAPTIGSLAGAGALQLGTSDPNTILVIAGSTSTTYSGVISGPGSIELDDAASLRLTGTGSVIGGDLDLCLCSTGSLTIDGGSLTVNGFAQGVTVEGGTLSVINGGTLQVGPTSGVFGDLLVASNMTIDGPGSTVTVTAGGFTGVGLLGPGALTISNGGVLNSQSGAEVDSLFGPATVVVTGPGSQWNIGDFGLSVGGGTTGGIGTLTIADGAVVNTNVAFIGDNVDGSSFVLVTGPGSRLTATVGLSIGDGGCGCGPLVGTLTISDGGVVEAADTRILPGSTLRLGTGGLGGTLITPTILNDGAIVADFTDGVTLAADISGTGTLSKAGVGTLTLTGNNSYAGGTTITGGFINFNLATSFGTGLITIDGGGLQWATGNTADISSQLAALGAGGATFDTNGNNVTLASPLSGTGGLTKVGAGTMTLSGGSNYLGATNVNSGTLQAGAVNTFSAASAFTVAGGATLDLNHFNQTIGSLAGDGNVTLGSATLTTGGDNTSTTFAGGISGTGGLIKTGSGIMTLTGINSYTGGTAINGGVLQLGDTDTTGKIVGSVTNNALFFIVNADTSGITTITNNASTSFLNNSSASSATITNNNNGLLSFADTSTAANAIITTNNFALTQFTGNATAGNAQLVTNAGGIVDFSGTSGPAGTNQVTAGSIEGAGTYFLGANQLTVGGNNLSTTVTGTIEDGGSFGGTGASVVKVGAGTLTLSGINTYSGGTTINGGTLAVAADNNLGASAGALAFGGGTLQFLSGFTTNRTVTLNAGGGTFDTNGNDATLAGTIGGSGGLTKLGLGTMTLSATGSYLGGTAVNAGTLQAGATNAFSPFSAFTIASGATLNLASFNQTIGSLAGAGNVTLGAATLTTGNDNTSTTFSGAISGTGGLTKIGTGTLLLTGPSNYTGATTVNAGTLSVNGSIASSALTVNAGGTIGGNGTIGNTTINGGTLSPGNSIGTLTVQGNLVLTSAAAYIVEVSPTAADRTNVTGTANLAGTVQAVFGPGAYIARTYTILSAAGGSTGTFGSLTTTGLPAGFSASLSYTATDAILNLTAILGGPSALGTGGLSTNQRNVAGSLNTFFNNGGTLPPSFLPIFGLTGGNLGNALSQLSGEAATGGQQVAFQMTNQFLGLMLDPFVDGRSGTTGAAGPALAFAPEREDLPDDIALAYSSVLKAPPAKTLSFEQRWSVWGGAYGGSNRTSGDPAGLGSHNLSANAAGFAAGFDYHLTPSTVVGLALAGGGTSWSLENGLGGGKSDAFQAGVYGATRWGAAYVAAALSYTHHWMSTDRFAFAGDHLTASFNAQSIGARVESGYRFATIYGGLTPYAAVQAQNFRTPSYSETDGSGGGFGLAYAGRTGTDTRSELGARFDRLLALNPNAVLTLRARLAWAHDWVSDPSLAAAFQILPGASFIVNGANPAKNSALASAGTELRLANGVTLLGKFDGEFASRSTTYAGTGTIRYSW